MPSTDMVYRHAADLVTRKVGDEAVVVPVRNRIGDLESVFTLNPIALRVWSLIDGATPVAPIVDAICDEYEVERDTAAADVVELLQTLEEAQLVERVSE
jgi:hypothetical protein